MKKIIIIITILISSLGISQTKQETLSYMNGVLNLKSNRTMYFSFLENENENLVVEAKLYLEGSEQIIYFEFDAEQATFIDSSTDNNGRTRFFMSFNPQTVNLLFDIDGNSQELLSQIKLGPLEGFSASDKERFIKAYKHLIKISGGQIKENPF